MFKSTKALPTHRCRPFVDGEDDLWGRNTPAPWTQRKAVLPRVHLLTQHWLVWLLLTLDISIQKTKLPLSGHQSYFCHCKNEWGCLRTLYSRFPAGLRMVLALRNRQHIYNPTILSTSLTDSGYWSPCLALSWVPLGFAFPQRVDSYMPPWQQCSAVPDRGCREWWSTNHRNEGFTKLVSYYQ